MSGIFIAILFRSQYIVVGRLSVLGRRYIGLGDFRFHRTSVHDGDIAHRNENENCLLLVDLSKIIEAIKNGFGRDDDRTSCESFVKRCQPLRCCNHLSSLPMDRTSSDNCCDVLYVPKSWSRRYNWRRGPLNVHTVSRFFGLSFSSFPVYVTKYGLKYYNDSQMTNWCFKNFPTCPVFRQIVFFPGIRNGLRQNIEKAIFFSFFEKYHTIFFAIRFIEITSL